MTAHEVAGDGRGGSGCGVMSSLHMIHELFLMCFVMNMVDGIGCLWFYRQLRRESPLFVFLGNKKKIVMRV
jgi:hypothetical protein